MSEHCELCGVEIDEMDKLYDDYRDDFPMCGACILKMERESENE